MKTPKYLATMILKSVVCVIHIITIILVIIIWPMQVEVCAQEDSTTWPIAKPGCDSGCGDVPIPYPFGMNRSECYAGKWFEIECRNSTRPYLKSIGLGVEVLSIDVNEGTVDINNPIYRSNNCGTRTTKHPAVNNISLEGSPFVYSQRNNKFVAAGCNNIAFLKGKGSAVSGCVSICDNDDDVGNTNLGRIECNGESCCENSLPMYLSEYTPEIKGLNENKKGNHCSYAMIVKNKPYPYSYQYQCQYPYQYPYQCRYPYSYQYQCQYGYSNLLGVGKLKDIDFVPAVLEWEIVNATLKLPTSPYVDCKVTNITSSRYNYSGRRCSCRYEAYYNPRNPYIADGCPADYHAYPPPKPTGLTSRAKQAIIGVSASLGSIILLLVLWRMGKVVWRIGKAVIKTILHKRREMFYKKNGGLLLEQMLSSGEVNDDKVKLFSLKDLEKATDNFNKNRVLGKGGQGTVYKGMLPDGKITAVKKFKVEGNVEEFINEFIILSQINHRNVVQLLGSCLETEIPLLVYEFIPNGNLFEYLHGQNEDFPMTWDIRLRIATEVAGALFYLHLAASRPIYHRDIKSTNILLDEKYRAKVADFGTSRMVTIDATHLTTVVQGTFGYLDPEYFHTSQFTEKSDVYSFGVVLVELLTGKKPISLLNPEEAKSLASSFILCLEENRLFDIVDERVVKEGEKEHIMAVANLASRCLELNGKKRPTMKEVTLELEGIRKLEGKSNTQERHDDNELEHVPIGDYQSWTEYSTASNISSTLDLNNRTPALEDIHIHTI
ncbi:Wall-associated receptor kinase-like 22 [Glycine soja]